MTQDSKDSLHWSADDGKTFVNKETGNRIGWDMYLATYDSIENYEEKDMTDDEKAEKDKFKKRDDKAVKDWKSGWKQHNF